MKLAARIAVSNLHKKTMTSFSETYVTVLFSSTPAGQFDYPPCNLVLSTCLCRVKVLHTHYDERSGLMAPLIADDVYEIIMKVRCTS